MTVKNNMKKSLGLYLHIPFCKQKCNYCDFYSLGCHESKIPQYIDALCTHIKKEAHLYRDYQIDTVFLGGGTPSLVDETDFEKLAYTLRECFNITQNAELSLEANPGTLTREKLNCYKRSGVNRISVGLQSTDDSQLKILGRIHTLEEFKESYSLIRECGFDNVNIDIMYGLPNQSVDALSKTVNEVCSLSPEHISAYCLKIEENTPFYKMRNSLNLPTDDEEYEMYIKLVNDLKAFGYEQYEISNFAKNNRRCVHNLKYWLSHEYVGFGPSAHSFFDGKRYFYENSIESYISSINSADSVDNLPKKHYEMDTELAICGSDEYVMLKMRLSDGVSEEEFENKYGASFTDEYPKILNFLKDGYVIYRDGAYSFTEKGFFVSNYILSQILKFN